MANKNEERDNSGIVRTAGAASILLATAIGYFIDPLGNGMLSAGILGGVAALSFAARGLFTKKN